MAVQIQVRRDTAANWASYNPTLASGEIGYDITNRIVKMGDGSTPWNSLTAFPVPLDALTVGAGITIDLLPDADGTLDIGSNDLRFADIHGDLDGAVTIYARAGEALAVGDVVYISGKHGGTDLPIINKADASNAATMPAFGLVRDAVASGDNTHVVTVGRLDGVSLTSYAVGEKVYVSGSTPGAFTNVPPTGEGSLIQNIGYVVKQGANGELRVGGAGRSNATPNLDDGNIFIGNASGQAVTASLATEIANNLPTITIDADAGTPYDLNAVGSLDLQSANSSIVTTVNPAGLLTVSHALPVGGILTAFPSSITVDARGHVSAVGSPKTPLGATDNLSDLTDIAAARDNLELGTAATADLGTWQTAPVSGTVIRLFDDMLGITGRNSKTNVPFFGLGTSGSYWQDSYGLLPASGETGVARAYLNANAYARCTINGMQLYDAAAPDGTEFLFQGRFYLDFNSTAANNPSFSLGAFCPKVEHNDGTTEQGFGYGDTAKAGVYWQKNNTYWKSYYYDTEGTNGGTIEADLTSFTGAEDTWFICAVHAKKETLFTIPTWVVRSYINGTLAATQYLTSGTEAPTFYANVYNSGSAYQNNMYVDWLMLQYTRPNSVTYLDIEDL